MNRTKTLAKAAAINCLYLAVGFAGLGVQLLHAEIVSKYIATAIVAAGGASLVAAGLFALCGRFFAEPTRRTSGTQGEAG